MNANWNRFTLMDGAALVAAFALGTSVATHFTRLDTPSAILRPSAGWAVSCILLSGVLAGPFILLSQGIRGRRFALSSGEWLWLAPVLLLLFVYAIGHFSGERLVLWVEAQCIFSIAAFLRIVAIVFGMKANAACRWTDLAGSSVCAAVGPAILYGILQAMSQL